MGLDPDSVQRVLGAPASITKGDPSLVWTYSGANCSFQIIFYPDIKTTAFHALKFSGTPGHDAPDNVQTCIRSILMAKNNGPG